jgi:hypothetical protein
MQRGGNGGKGSGGKGKGYLLPLPTTNSSSPLQFSCKYLINDGIGRGQQGYSSTPLPNFSLMLLLLFNAHALPPFPPVNADGTTYGTHILGGKGGNGGKGKFNSQNNWFSVRYLHFALNMIFLGVVVVGRWNGLLESLHRNEMLAPNERDVEEFSHPPYF